jgi:hypothetical protein
MELPDWIPRAKSVVALTVDVCFLISDSYYFGDENDLGQFRRPEFREPLYQPKIDRYGNVALTSSVENSVSELIAYYRDVVRLAEKHRKTVQAHYFWLRPLIFEQNEFAISFPWYDTQQESERFLWNLSRSEPGEIFWDADQCWELTVWADADTLYFREWDPDHEEEHAVVRCNKLMIQGQISAVQERLTSVLQRLREAIGHDFWSR